jgi:hypothetical protein
MIKRVNFTGRRRIPRDRVQIEVLDGRPRRFNALINLDDISLLPHAAVFLEAMCAGSTVIERFPCGEVGDLQVIRDRPLDEIEGENVFFTLKVIDRTERFGRILGIAENIRPERSGKQTAAGRRGILPIEPKDLGEEIWRLEFREHDVFLLVNDKILGLVDRARTDPLFYSVVYPEVVRCILAKAIEENVEIDEDEDRWPVLWQRFGKDLHPDRSDPPKSDDVEEEKDDWIEDVVKAFCETHSLKAKYLAGLVSANGSDQ